jgi:hypothetical protein
VQADDERLPFGLIRTLRKQLFELVNHQEQPLLVACLPARQVT